MPGLLRQHKLQGGSTAPEIFLRGCLMQERTQRAEETFMRIFAVCFFFVVPKTLQHGKYHSEKDGEHG